MTDVSVPRLSPPELREMSKVASRARGFTPVFDHMIAERLCAMGLLVALPRDEAVASHRMVYDYTEAGLAALAGQ